MLEMLTHINVQIYLLKTCVCALFLVFSLTICNKKSFVRSPLSFPLLIQHCYAIHLSCSYAFASIGIPFWILSSLLLIQTLLKSQKHVKSQNYTKSYIRRNVTPVPSSHRPLLCPLFPLTSVDKKSCWFLLYPSCVSFHTNGQINVCFLIFPYLLHESMIQLPSFSRHIV